MRVFVLIGWDDDCPEDGQWCAGVFSTLALARAHVARQGEIHREEDPGHDDTHGWRITEHAIDDAESGRLIEDDEVAA